MSDFQEAISPRRVVSIGGRNYEIAKAGPGLFSDFEAESRAQRVRELRSLGLSPLEFGESVAAIQRGSGGDKDELKRSLSSSEGMFILIFIVLRKTNAALTLAATKALLDAEPSAIDEIMEAMGIQRDGESGGGAVSEEDGSKNLRAAQA
jgi:hypothetical protein